MIYMLTFVHVVVCFFLILVVLLQTGKGADVAAAFGGVSQTAFGARGGVTLLSKLTTGSAILFMLTSLVLAVISTGPSSSVVDQASPASSAAPATQAPATQAPAQPAGSPAAPAPGAPGQAAPSGSSPAEAANETPGSGPGGF